MLRIIERKTDSAARMRERDEVNRTEFDSVLRITQEHHLFPFDLPQRVVLDDDDLDRQIIQPLSYSAADHLISLLVESFTRLIATTPFTHLFLGKSLCNWVWCALPTYRVLAHSASAALKS